MTKSIILCASILGISFAAMAASPLLGKDLVLDHNRWSVDCDTFSSKLDTGTSLFVEGVATAKFRQGRTQRYNDNTYVEMFCKLTGGNLDSVETIHIVYRSSDSLVVKFSQPDLSDPPEGDGSYALYQYKIGDSPDTFAVADIPIWYSSQPEWTPRKSKNVTFKPEKVNTLYFSPNLDDKIGGKAEIEIKSISMFPKQN